MKVGDTIWFFDINRRVYRPREPGRLYASGGPIYREHWRPVVIESETSRSWVTCRGKAPKKGSHYGWAFNQQEVDNDCWINDYRLQLSKCVNNCDDAETLRVIAGLVGYMPERKP